MLVYFSTELLKELLDYYLPRYRLAVERGFAVQGSNIRFLPECTPSAKFFTHFQINKFILYTFHIAVYVQCPKISITSRNSSMDSTSLIRCLILDE
mgnify:CR=1 FL=1